MGNANRYAPWFFLFPALFYFFLLVIYPIFGSFWISFHDWNGTTFQCSDGRSLLELKEDESCRRVPVMTWVGLENYERFFSTHRFNTKIDQGRDQEIFSARNCCHIFSTVAWDTKSSKGFTLVSKTDSISDFIAPLIQGSKGRVNPIFLRCTIESGRGGFMESTSRVFGVEVIFFSLVGMLNMYSTSL